MSIRILTLATAAATTLGCSGRDDDDQLIARYLGVLAKCSFATAPSTKPSSAVPLSTPAATGR
jgi:hypothetical protein